MAALVVKSPTRANDVLDLPSATTMRFVLMAAAMLVAGLFLGGTVFGAVDGRAFAAAVVACAGRPEGTCLAPIENQYALFALGGTLAVAVTAAVVILSAPSVLVRRHRLREPGPLGAAATARVAAFSADIGLRRAPRLLMGSARLHDAFCLGRPGRYAVALPMKLLLGAETSLFEAALRHELAHVRYHDVALSWLARAVGYALAPLMLVPVVLFVLNGEPALLPDYVWRYAVIAVVVVLAACSALRSRELSADVAAARLAGPAVGSALPGLRAPATAPWRRMIAVHPSRDERVAAVHEPGRTAVVTAVDGAVLGFLVALALPTLDEVLTAVLPHVTDGGPAFVAASAVLLGPLPGATLGLGLFRQAVVTQAGARRTSIAPVLAGVAGGAIAGQLSSLAGVGLNEAAGFDHPGLVLVVAVALTGATALTAGCAEMAAAAPAVRPTAAAVSVAATALFVTVLWAADVVGGLLDQAGWAGIPPTVRIALPGLVAPVAIALAVASAIWSTCRRAAPVTVAPRAPQTLAAGVAAGVGAGAVIIANRVRLGAPLGTTDVAERLMDNWWIAAGGGAAAAATLALTCGRSGWGAGLLAGPVAAVITAAVDLGQLTATNGLPLPVGTVALVAGPDVALGLLVTIPIAALVPAHRPPAAARPTALIVGCAALLAVVAGSAAVAATTVLTAAAVVESTPRPSAGAPLAQPPLAAPDPTTPAEPVTRLSTPDYKVIAPSLSHGYTAVRAEMDAVDRESAPAATRVEQINERVLPDLRWLLTQARTIAPTDVAVAALHDHLLTSLQLAILAHQDFVTSLAGNDAAALARGRAELSDATGELTIWTTGVSRL